MIEQVFESIALAIDFVGIGIILLGFSLSFKDFVVSEVSGVPNIAALKNIQIVRCQLGTYLLVGLEFMIASDIIHLFISRSQDNLIFLGMIIVIRTVTEFFPGQNCWSSMKNLLRAHSYGFRI